jgi:hypothetical protein
MKTQPLSPEIIALAQRMFDTNYFHDRTKNPEYIAATCLRAAVQFYSVIDRARAGESLEAIEASL